MVELIKPNEKIREITEAPRHIPIEVEASSAFEAILVMWTTFDPGQMNTSQALGAEFHDRVRELTPDDLVDEIHALGGPHCAVWLSVSGLLHTAPHPHEPGPMFDWLGQISGKRLHRWLLGYMSHGAGASQIEEAVNKDREAVRELCCPDWENEKAEQFIALFDIPADQLPGRVATVLRRFKDEVFDKLDIDFAGSIERAAVAQRSRLGDADAKSVIEDVTKGLDYDIPLGVARVALIPSVVTRPLSVIDQHRDTLIVYYGMADEFIDADPDSPPSWLVNTYKALSDERRLRILRRISEGDTTLDDLTEMLGLSKSTVHHHISVLRGAGLIRIRIPSGDGKKHKNKVYSLRDQTLGDAAGFLDSYLSAQEKGAEQHA